MSCSLMLKALCLHHLHDQWEQDGVGGWKGCGQQSVLDMEGQSGIGVAEVVMGPPRPAFPTPFFYCCQESGSLFCEVVGGSAWLAEGADKAGPVLSSMKSTSST